MSNTMQEITKLLGGCVYDEVRFFPSFTGFLRFVIVCLPLTKNLYTHTHTHSLNVSTITLVDLSFVDQRDFIFKEEYFFWNGRYLFDGKT